MFIVAYKQSQSCRGQRGIVLPVALITMVAATLLALGFMRMNALSLRIGGASVVAEETQTAAELLLGGFFSRNPVVATDARIGRYTLDDARCGTTAELTANANRTDVFDCRQISDSKLVTNLTTSGAASASAPVVQRIGCGSGPRSSTPTQAGARFYYYDASASVVNSFFGSRADVGAGIANLVVAGLNCPP